MLKSSVLFLATCLLLPHGLAQPVTGRRRGSDDFLEFDDHRFRDDDFFPDRSGTDDSHRIPFPMMQAMLEDNPFLLGRQFGPPPPPPAFIPGPPPPPAFIPGPPPPPAFIPGPPPPPFFPGPPPVFVGGPPPPFVPGPPPPFFPGPAPVFLWGPPPPWFSFPPHMYREPMPKHRHDCKFNSKAGPTPHKEETPYNGKKKADYDQPRPLPVKYNAEQNRPYVPPTPVYVNSNYEYPKEERLQEVSNAYQPDPLSHVNEARPPYERQRYPVNDFPYERKS